MVGLIFTRLQLFFVIAFLLLLTGLVAPVLGDAVLAYERDRARQAIGDPPPCDYEYEWESRSEEEITVSDDQGGEITGRVGSATGTRTVTNPECLKSEEELVEAEMRDGIVEPVETMQYVSPFIRYAGGLWLFFAIVAWKKR